MGAVLSKKTDKRQYYTKKQVSTSRGIYSKIRSGTGYYKRLKPVTYQKPTLQAPQLGYKKLNENMPQFSVLPFMAGDKSTYPLANTALLKAISSSDLPHDGDLECEQPELKISTEPEMSPVPGCLEYEGFHEYGFHIFTIDSDKFFYEATKSICLAIQDNIGRITNEDSFIIIYQSGTGRTAFIADEYSSGDELFQGLVNRFQHQLKRFILWKPSWDIVSTVENGESPFSIDVLEKLNLTEDVKKFGRLAGFPGEIKTKPSTSQKAPHDDYSMLYENLPQFSGDKTPCSVSAEIDYCENEDLLHDGDLECEQLGLKSSTEPEKFPVTDCLEYEGFHEYGFHIFNINSDTFFCEATQKNCVAIQESIENKVSWEDRFLIIYKSRTGQPCFIADEYCFGDELFQGLVNQFQHQLMRIVLWKPSWYILNTFEDETSESPFSVNVLEKLRTTSDIMELGRLTGFPGQIIRK